MNVLVLNPHARVAHMHGTHVPPSAKWLLRNSYSHAATRVAKLRLSILREVIKRERREAIESACHGWPSDHSLFLRLIRLRRVKLLHFYAFVGILYSCTLLHFYGSDAKLLRNPHPMQCWARWAHVPEWWFMCM